jgi:hypothetical protein
VLLSNELATGWLASRGLPVLVSVQLTATIGEDLEFIPIEMDR